jgi:ribonuclease P/MRP protein subunit RPP1
MIVGYGAVALNHKVEGKLPKTTCPIVKLPLPLRQYTRLTLVLDDPQQNYGINSGNEVVRSYDLLAVQPETEKMFISACTSLDVDIICFDLSGRIPFAIKAGYIRQALQRGVSFEIIYAPVVVDSTARRNAIGGARMLLRLALGKGGLLISSGAEGVWQLRAPADVLNLAGLLGVTGERRKECLVKIPEAVFMHAASRKHTYRSAIAIIPTDHTNETTKGDTLKSTDMLEDFLSFH